MRPAWQRLAVDSLRRAVVAGMTGCAPSGTAAAAVPARSRSVQTLIQTSGTGRYSSVTFSVGDGWQVGFTYDCSNVGGVAGFELIIHNGDGSPSDAASYLNVRGHRGTATHTYRAGGTYFIVVETPCRWRLTVRGHA